MKINCLAIDDEPLALKQMVNYIEKTPFLNLVSATLSPIEALEILDNETIHLLFIDIQMPDLNGIELTKSLTNPPKIIFTTAFENYAIEGFKVNAVDYLLKPISYQDFLSASNRAKEVLSLKKVGVIVDDFIFIRSENKMIKIILSEITHVEGLKDYLKIFYQGNYQLTLMTFKALLEKLPANFMRIHRSHIINLDKIDSIEKNKVKIDAYEVPVGDSYKKEFSKFIEDKFL